ncbi:alpha/beta fold hydrolase [Sinobaca sp. H24]|uniref:alpha/beta fold hydrolase n=2 Tax=Sinobaca sp. H24 TaxID=2923376 RepID=UPI002079B02C|nr:alpha/beta hydrolase [Sinobaca sp. H24]
MSHYIEVEPKVHLFVEDIGSGPPVVFIHGWPVHHEMFEQQMNVLPDQGYRFIGIDMRGFGRSDTISSGYSYDQLADDIRVVFDKLSLKKAVLVGFSMGGGVASRYMGRHQGHGVSKLVLASAAAPKMTQSENFADGLPTENVDGLIQGALQDRAATVQQVGQMFLGENTSDALRAHFQDMGMASSSLGMVGVAESLRDADLRPDLKSITVPTAIFHGTKDQLTPFVFAEHMNKTVENSFIVTFQESGHSTIYDEPETFNKELLAFLSS